VTAVDELTLSIGDLARRTGVDIPTLRRWERYEGLLAPVRTPGGQRRYGPRDVEAIQEVVSLVERGWPPSSAAKAVAAHRDTGAVVFDAELFDAVPEGIVITNADFEVLYINRHLAAVLGADRDEAESALNLGVLDEESLAEVRQAFQDVRHGNNSTSAIRVRTRAGDLVDLEVVAGPLLAPAGRIRGAIAIVRDLGRRRAVQRDLQVTRQLLDASGDALVAVERDGTVLAWSSGAESTFGRPADQAIGAPLAEQLPTTLARSVADAVEDACDGTSTSFDVHDGTGPTPWLRIHVAPLLAHDVCIGATIAATTTAEADHPASGSFQGVIAAISQSLLRDDPLQTIVDTAVEGVARALGADHVVVLELRRADNEQIVFAATGGQAAGSGPATGPFGSHVAFAIQSHRPIVVRDFAAERRFDRGPLAGEQAAVSGVCVPVQWTGGGEGALCVHSSTDHLAMTSGDITFVQSAANLCALARARGTGA
jgi:PAS domain S-box-containing protein